MMATPSRGQAVRQSGDVFHSAVLNVVVSRNRFMPQILR